MTPWLTDQEINDLCDGLKTNSAKTRHLRGMGLVVHRKPNGRALVMRNHAEAVLSGLKQLQAEQSQQSAERPRPNREAFILAFGNRKQMV